VRDIGTVTVTVTVTVLLLGISHPHRITQRINLILKWAAARGACLACDIAMLLLVVYIIINTLRTPTVISLLQHRLFDLKLPEEESTFPKEIFFTSYRSPSNASKQSLAPSSC
jgi:hypothetical protein